VVDEGKLIGERGGRLREKMASKLPKISISRNGEVKRNPYRPSTKRSFGQLEKDGVV